MAVKIMCAAVFVAFSFLWLYFFQADILTVTQHVLSHGQTTYNRTMGTLLITAILLSVYGITNRLMNLPLAVHALSLFPSMLLLGVISSANVADKFEHWWLGIPLVVLWLGVSWVCKKVHNLRASTTRVGRFPRYIWVNMLLIILMLCGVIFASNTNAVHHFRARAEIALLNGHWDEALTTGHESLETDSCLMTIRMYALSRTEQLGEKLFQYPLIPSSDAMLPTRGERRLLVYPMDSLYRYLGAIPHSSVRPMDYLRKIVNRYHGYTPAVDYLLCGYLLDRDLDRFAVTVARFYALDEHLPRHYREALVLYKHLRSHPVINYQDAVLDVDYDDFHAIQESATDKNDLLNKLQDDYSNSYWYYYYTSQVDQ